MADTSWCRCLIETVRWQPDNTQRFAFWRFCRLAMEVCDALWNLTGAAHWYTNYEIHLCNFESLCCPRVASGDPKMRSCENALVVASLVCWAKLGWESKWIQSILGFLSGWSEITYLRIEGHFWFQIGIILVRDEEDWMKFSYWDREPLVLWSGSPRHLQEWGMKS